MYGGRAIDNFDRRVLNTYMDEYMGDFIFDTFQPFHFFHNEEVDYYIPELGLKDVYLGMSRGILCEVMRLGLTGTEGQNTCAISVFTADANCVTIDTTVMHCMLALQNERDTQSHGIGETPL